MSENYNGPYCNVTMADGRVFSVQGTHAEVTHRVRDLATHGFAVLTDVYGQEVTIGVAHVASIQQPPNDFSVA